MEDLRANPDMLLKAIKQEENSKKQGTLKIFFGYAAGVGKTYAMLKAAHAALKRGVDVVVGYVEPHSRPKTAALLNGLEVLPNLEAEQNGITLKEFDLDAAIKRNPSLVIVDELAHTNAEACRHNKRYQDVEELLKAGIDVYTTVNVQHIESLNDIVAAITGVSVRERIPDKVFDSASQVELVDIEPKDLLERLNAGDIYKVHQAQRAMENFFTEDNLTALREIALRRCADRVNKLTETARIKNNGEYYTDEHLLVCLSPSPTNPKIIRTAARMADAFKGSFTAIFVETPDFQELSDDDKKRLKENTRLAEQLGANVETVYGDDVSYQISEFARLSGVSKIVVGRNNARRKYFFSKPTLTEMLVLYAPNIDIYIIPDKNSIPPKNKASYKTKLSFNTGDVLKSLGVLVTSTVIGFLFYNLGFSEANIIMCYILGVLVTAVITSQRIYSLMLSVISVLVFNFFFTEPIFTLNAYDSGYPVTFLIMFLVAFMVGSLTAKMKQHARKSAETAYRTKVLFDANYLLQKAEGTKDIISVTANQLVKLLNRDIIFYPAENGDLAKPLLFPYMQDTIEESCLSPNEVAVASWVLKNNKHAGATTNTLPESKCLYLAVRVNDNVYGVIGIVMDSTSPDAFENSILLSIIGECALALENEKTAYDKEQTAIRAEKEQLRANLLRSISHDLRTPLTSISGNAANLLNSEITLDENTRKSIYSDIYDDSMWLINLVENLLSVTRIEDGTMNLNFSTELVDEAVDEALRHLNRKSADHVISFTPSEDIILAKMDSRLIVQVIINIVDNAIKYTQDGSKITIKTYKQDKKAVVEISDDGDGIPDEAKPKIFDMFYTGTSKIADSRRSLGLGLALCKTIINSHGGDISVMDNAPKGAVIKFTLPREEVNINE